MDNDVLWSFVVMLVNISGSSGYVVLSYAVLASYVSLPMYLTVIATTFLFCVIGSVILVASPVIS